METKVETTLATLRTDLDQHRAALADVAERRKRLALDAAQGNALALSALSKLDERELASMQAVKNLKAAIAEAEKLIAAEREQKAKVERLRREVEASNIGVAIVDLDAKIVEAAKAVSAMLDERDTLVKKITALRVLLGKNLRKLGDGLGVAAMLVDVFGSRLRQHYALPTPENGIDDFVTRDHDALGLPRPERKLTHFQKEMLRGLHPREPDASQPPMSGLRLKARIANTAYYEPEPPAAA